MPLYKYRCTECDNDFEVLKLNGDKEDGKPECTECGSLEVERKVSNVGIRFKGSGFYRTDYDSNSNYKGNGSNNGSSGGSSEAASEGDASQGE